MYYLKEFLCLIFYSVLETIFLLKIVIMVEKLTKNTFSSMLFYFMYMEFYVLTINKEASK